MVRAVRTDAYIRPNEGRRKVYLFPDCALLTEQDQNVLLKIVEEGPPYAAFLFCAENPSQVLQTLRSRCVELKLRPAADTDAGELSEAAEMLLRCLGGKKRGAVSELAVRLEKKKTTREDLSALLERCRAVCAAALLLSFAMGLLLCKRTTQYVRKNTKGMMKPLLCNIARCFVMHIVPLLVIASVVETYVTPWVINLFL